MEVGALVDNAATEGDLTDGKLWRLFAGATGLTDARLADAWEVVEDALVTAIPDGAGLYVRPGGWVVSLRAAGVKSVVAAALVAGAMWHAGLNQLPGYVAPAVLPLLIDVRQVRLTRNDRNLLVDLRLSQEASQEGWPWPAEALYGRLPPDVQARVSPTDFADFIERLVQAGEVDPAGYEEVTLRPTGHPAWIRLTIE